MTTTIRKGLLLAGIHVLLVASLGATLSIDRARYPRVWARTGPIDPDLPIRGRYVSLRLEVEPGSGLVLPSSEPAPAPEPGAPRQPPRFSPPVPVRLVVEQERLVALPAPRGSLLYARQVARGDDRVAALVRPVAFFIPPDVPDPSIRTADEQLWVEVTVPPRGLPRPIRLGVRRGNGPITALD
jgi:hypothetical protein